MIATRTQTLESRATPTVGVVFTTYNRPQDLAARRTDSPAGMGRVLQSAYLPRTPPVSTILMACSTLKSVSSTLLRGR